MIIYLKLLLLIIFLINLLAHDFAHDFGSKSIGTARIANAITIAHLKKFKTLNFEAIEGGGKVSLKTRRRQRYSNRSTRQYSSSKISRGGAPSPELISTGRVKMYITNFIDRIIFDIMGFINFRKFSSYEAIKNAIKNAFNYTKFSLLTDNKNNGKLIGKFIDEARDTYIMMENIIYSENKEKEGMIEDQIHKDKKNGIATNDPNAIPIAQVNIAKAKIELLVNSKKMLFDIFIERKYTETLINKFVDIVKEELATDKPIESGVGISVDSPVSEGEKLKWNNAWKEIEGDSVKQYEENIETGQLAETRVSGATINGKRQAQLNIPDIEGTGVKLAVTVPPDNSETIIPLEWETPETPKTPLVSPSAREIAREIAREVVNLPEIACDPETPETPKTPKTPDSSAETLYPSAETSGPSTQFTFGSDAVAQIEEARREREREQLLLDLAASRDSQRRGCQRRRNQESDRRPFDRAHRAERVDKRPGPPADNSRCVRQQRGGENSYLNETKWIDATTIVLNALKPVYTSNALTDLNDLLHNTDGLFGAATQTVVSASTIITQKDIYDKFIYIIKIIYNNYIDLLNFSEKNLIIGISSILTKAEKEPQSPPDELFSEPTAIELDEPNPSTIHDNDYFKVISKLIAIFLPADYITLNELFEKIKLQIAWDTAQSVQYDTAKNIYEAEICEYFTLDKDTKTACKEASDAEPDPKVIQLATESEIVANKAKTIIDEEKKADKDNEKVLQARLISDMAFGNVANAINEFDTLYNEYVQWSQVEAQTDEEKQEKQEKQDQWTSNLKTANDLIKKYEKEAEAANKVFLEAEAKAISQTATEWGENGARRRSGMPPSPPLIPPFPPLISPFPPLISPFPPLISPFPPLISPFPPLISPFPPLISPFPPLPILLTIASSVSLNFLMSLPRRYIGILHSGTTRPNRILTGMLLPRKHYV